MPIGPSILSMVASGIYTCVVAACLAAAMSARVSKQPPGHFWAWLLLALFFAVLIALRLFDAEEMVRSSLREAMRAEGSYRERRTFQKPIVALILVIAGIGGLILMYRLSRNMRGRRNIARAVAMAAAIVMLLLMTLRMISLHAVDALLYGPAKFNWVVDLGASVTIVLAGMYYVRLILRRS